MKRMGLLSILSLVLVLPFSQAFALDTDLYAVTSVDVPPNVLIMFDNSISMNETVSGAVYDPNTIYPFVVTDTPNKVYYKTGGGNWNLYRDSIDLVICDSVKTALQSYGFYTGKIKSSTSECGTTNNVNLQTGNYLNYMQVTGGPADRPKLGLAKGIIQSYINTTDGVRFGAMIFNYNEGGHILKEIKDMTPQNRADLHAAIGGLQGNTYTPLAETLYETGLYFKGANSHFNKDADGNPIKYTSPVQTWCQKNYVIVITDGESTKDRNSILSTAVGDTDGDGREPGGAKEVPYDTEGSDYLDDVAKVLQDTDFDLALKDKQHITTYTVGFTVNSPLLERTAKHGKGKYFYCHNAQSFIIAMQAIIDEILAKSTSYVAPVVPISQMEKTSAGDRMYIAMFKPTKKSFWEGNIKKYGIATVKNGSIQVGDVLDASGALAMEIDPNTNIPRIRGDATSYWSSEPDGEKVTSGGVGEVLQNRTTARNIYTYLGTNPPSLDPFTLDNTAITPYSLGLPPNDDAGRNDVINFIHGKDAYDENGNGITNEKRDWILGAFIHSRPVVIHYDETYSVIFAGANDGMLHAFADDETGDEKGKELWAFIPPSLLPKLKNLSGESIEFFVDGAPKVYIGTDKKILIFGLRRGGDHYIALDITERLSPKFLWEIGPSTAGFQKLGQTWSTPHLGKIQLASGEKWVTFIGGGYDTNQDKTNPAGDTVGTAIYVVDVLTGERIWSYTNTDNVEMRYCVPSDVARVDTDGNGKINRLYVGDVGGRMWRVDIGDPNPAGWTAKIIFDSNAPTDGKRKIFYPPDVTLEKDGGDHEMLLFGTGDREHPKETTTINRLYAVKDRDPATPLTETHLEDVTLDLLQDPNTPLADKASILQSLKEKSGWLIKLDQNPGEKCLSVPVVFYGIAYYTTFSPTVGDETDICFVGEGTSRLYALKYKTGNAAFNLDDLGTIDNLTRSDRSMIIGATIPSGVIITFIGGTSVGYVGVGGGVYKPRLFSDRSIVPVTWRIVF